ncbi:MAG: phosphodiester glycosidase family protein [Paracoccaceae bacterium]|nr:hypothetical protein [Rhodobacterales bacterium]
MKIYILILAIWFTPVWSAECLDFEFKETSFTACTAKLPNDDIRLFLRDKNGKNFGQFQRLNMSLTEQGLNIVFATNGGMYHANRSPVGLYVENFTQYSPLITGNGPGNFGLVPNGVFCFNKKEFQIIETSKFALTKKPCQYATQSGPMLAIDGKIHPKFLKDGSSKFIRSGVGVTKNGLKAVFLISNEAINFYQFASTFLEHLDIDNALYLDGNVSRLYSPKYDRLDFGFDLGPIVAVVAPDG